MAYSSSALLFAQPRIRVRDITIRVDMVNTSSPFRKLLIITARVEALFF